MAKKEISFLHWILDLLPDDVTNKPFFGGRAFYWNEKIVLVVFESAGDKQYKDKIAKIEIWNGCMFPVEKEKHAQVLLKYPFLVHHPILPKWLYLPQSHDDFEELSIQLIKQIFRQNRDLFGAVPNKKNSGKTKVPKASKKNLKKEKPETINSADMKRPRMFADEKPEAIFEKAQTVADLKNLGPATYQQFQKAGIKTVQQFIKLGWKKAMVKLVKSNPKHRHTIYAYALIGALKNQDWHKLSEADKSEASQFVRSLKK